MQTTTTDYERARGRKKYHAKGDVPGRARSRGLLAHALIVVTIFLINTRFTIECWRSTPLVDGLFTSCRFFSTFALVVRTAHKLSSFLDIYTCGPKSMIGSPFLPQWVPATDSNVTWLEVARMILRHFADDKNTSRSMRSTEARYTILALDPWLETVLVSRLIFLKVCQLHTCTKATWVAHDHSIGFPIRRWRSCAWSLPSYIL